MMYLSRLALAFATLIMLTVMTVAASGSQADIPRWMKLKQGRDAYLGVAYSGRVPVCPTFELYVERLSSAKNTRGATCPTTQGGQRVTIVGWRMYSLGPHLVVPIVNVRLTVGPKGSWTAAVTPVVPIGVAVLVGGSDCSSEAARTHHVIANLSETLLNCRAIVKRQVVSGKSNTLIVKFLGSGDTIKTLADAVFLPGVSFSNGYPRYDLGHFVQ
jgi:hypothetical protein